VVERKVAGSLDDLGVWSVFSIGLVCAVAVVAFRKRESVLALLEARPGLVPDLQRHSPFAGGVVGGLCATLAATLSNDSALMMFLAGTGLVLLTLVYARSGPVEHSPGKALAQQL
jgi:hypothetical protein